MTTSYASFTFDHVAIRSVAAVDAPHIVKTETLEQTLAPTFSRLGLETNLVSSLTGVRERRLWDRDTKPSQWATEAAALALEKAGIHRRKVGAVVSTSVCKDFIEPSMAALVHGQLGLSPACLNFDIGNACLAFLTGMQIVGGLIERGQIDAGLVVDAESSREVLEATLERLSHPQCDRDTLRHQLATLTLGSGAAAMVLTRRDASQKSRRMLGSVSVAATEHRHLCQGQPEEMITDAAGLLTAGLELGAKTWQAAQEALGWMVEGFDGFIFHQVSAVHSARMCERLGIPMDRTVSLFDRFGNIGPASIPIALAHGEQTGRFSPGDRIALLGIGSGLNCTMMEIVV